MEQILDEALSALRLSQTLYPVPGDRLAKTRVGVKPKASLEAVLCVDGASLWFLNLTTCFLL